MRIGLASPPLALFIALALAAPAHGATTSHVNTELDNNDGSCAPAPGDCSLREANNASSAGDTIDLPAGTYQLGSVLVIDHALTVAGHGLASTIVTANGGHKGVLIAGGAQGPPGPTITRGQCGSPAAGARTL